MLPLPDTFSFDSFGTEIVYGRGRVQSLQEQCVEHGYERALIVCGKHVGANEALMAPIRDALGDRLAGVFAQTTPQKAAETVYEGIEIMTDLDADVVIGLGGGSSLNVARQVTVFAADGRSLAEYRAEARDREGEVTPPDPGTSPLPVLVVPTTFAGADLSGVGSVELLPAEESPTGQPIRTMGSNMPVATIHDPALFETTPTEALAGSAMNGFNKGLETIYARSANPITDSTAVHGLRLLSEAYPRLSDPQGTAGDVAPESAMDRAVAGNVLTQFERETSIIHAFGHAFARRYSVQQGVAHAVLAPHVLAYLFDRVDARRQLLADGLGIDAQAHSNGELADAIVERVDSIRASLDLPARLRAVDPVDRDDFRALAAFVVADSPMQRAPTGLEPTVEEMEAILERAW
jgi:alcohol dehydrogenase class IV